MRRQDKLPWAVAIVSVAFAVVGGSLLISRHARDRAELESRIAALERARREALAAPSPQAPSPAPAARAPEPHPSQASAREALDALTADYEQRLRAARDESKQALANADGLALKLQQLQARVQELQADNKRLGAAEHEASEDLSRANRVVNALQAELKAKDERLVQVEIANTKLKEQNGADAQRANQLLQVAQELQEVNRRRDVYLTSLLRRYKEVTDQYRALSAVVENRRDTDAAAVSGTDLARIQQAISMAEDDLRQVNALNAQALRIGRKLSGK
jgi:hypothetical protein